MSSRKRVFTLKDVSKHCSPGNIWIVIHGKVYDVSKFVAEVLLVAIIYYPNILSFDMCLSDGKGLSNTTGLMKKLYLQNIRIIYRMQHAIKMHIALVLNMPGSLVFIH